MIDYRQDDSHYLALCDVTQVDASVRVSKGLSRAARQRYSAIIVMERDRPAWFVDGRILAEEALRLTEEATQREETVMPLEMPIGEFLPHGRIGTVLSDLAFPISSNNLPVQVEDSAMVALGATATERNVYPLSQDGRVIGLLFSNETYKQRAATSPPTYVCKRNHINRDPDSGRCSFCPAKLTLLPPTTTP